MDEVDQQLTAIERILDNIIERSQGQQKFEITEDELQGMLNEAYEQGFINGLTYKEEIQNN